MTASQTVVGRIVVRKRQNLGLMLMAIGAAVLVASIAAHALMPPRALHDDSARGITPQ